MEKKKIGNIILVLGGVALLTGIGTYLYQQYKLIDSLCYGIKGFRFKKIGIESTTTELSLSVKNKGELDIEIKKMIMDVYANGIFVAKINQEVSTSIKPFEESKLPFNVTFNPRQLMGSVATILSASSMNNMSFKFKGKVVVKKFGLPISIPFEFSYTVAEMKTPSTTDICEENKKK